MTSHHQLPRVVIAAPGSGHGKTTVATGLMAALRRTGLVVSGHKVGPDYIDPGYHALATGRPGRNLDPRLVGEHRIAPLLVHGALTPEPAQIAVIEGVMGLFDGQLGGDGFASTGHVAALTQSPVILVVDASGVSRTVGAMVAGLASFDPQVQIAGAIINKAASPRHAAEIAAAMPVPVLGTLSRDRAIELPSRHLGLVTAAEQPQARAVLDHLTELVADQVDLAAVLQIARSAPPLTTEAWQPDREVISVVPAGAPRPVIALASGPAFTFCYAETRELLTAAGAQVVDVDPLTDSALPEGTRALYLGGGFPEVHAAALGANTTLLRQVKDAIGAGLPTVAECAGLLYLGHSLDGVPMVGALDAVATMTPRLTLGYRQATLPEGTILGGLEQPIHGHEFHRTTTTPGHGSRPAWVITGPADQVRSIGFGAGSVHASYLHVHWAGAPALAAHLVAAALQFDPTLVDPTSDGSPETAAGAQAVSELAAGLLDAAPLATPPLGQDAKLRHHGDVEARAARWDYAVNVCTDPRPAWLEEALARGLFTADAYPDATPAAQALARRHGLSADQVLPTAGAAEAFTLVARLRAWTHPVVVQPQFTEPESALRSAGLDPQSVVLATPFTLDPALVPDDADLVIIGNPTNPTGVLHPAAQIASLCRPGRLVVVDEAFIDFVPGEAESLIGRAGDQLLVLRSLTKLWSIPGIRAGFAVGSAALIGDLAALQTPWSVSCPAIEAMVAIGSAQAAAVQEQRALASQAATALLISRLTDLGIDTLPSRGPFVLARVPAGTHARLAGLGVAVRRCDTFTGLDPDPADPAGQQWVRIAVRPDADQQPLLRALAGQPPEDEGRAGEVVLVSAGPGDPGLITVAGREALRRAEVVITDRLVPLQALAWIAPQAEVIDVAKVPYGPQPTQEQINDLLVTHTQAGRRVVRLKGGDSFVFGRGAEEIEHLAAHGIDATVIPGVSSATSVPALAGIPITHRGTAQGFAVISGHVGPDHAASTVNWAALAQTGVTLVVLMGVKQLPGITAALIEGGLDPQTPAAMIADGALSSQRQVVATVATIAEQACAAGLGAPAITVIGHTVGFPGRLAALREQVRRG